MKFFLIVAKGKRRGFPVPIDVDLFLIGHAKACQLRADHPAIGEQHCAIAIRDRKAFIRDLGSGHGTFVNGSEMPASEEWPLHKNDLIAVGPLEFRVEIIPVPTPADGTPLPTKLTPLAADPPKPAAKSAPAQKPAGKSTPGMKPAGSTPAQKPAAKSTPAQKPASTPATAPAATTPPAPAPQLSFFDL